MTSWFATGRPALLDALASACDLVDQQIASGTSFFDWHDRGGDR